MKRARRGNGGNASSVIPSSLTRKSVNNTVYRVCRGEPERAFNVPLLNTREVFSKIALTTSEEKAAFSRSFAPKLPAFLTFAPPASSSESACEIDEYDCVQALNEKPEHDENSELNDSTKDSNTSSNNDINDASSISTDIDFTNDSGNDLNRDENRGPNKNTNKDSINDPKTDSTNILIDNEDDSNIPNAVADENEAIEIIDGDEMDSGDKICVGCGQAIEEVSFVVCQRSFPHYMCKGCLNEAINREVQWYLHTEWERPAYVSFHCPACNSVVSVTVAAGAAGFPFVPLKKKSKIASEKTLFDSWLDIAKKINMLEDNLSSICKVVVREATSVSSISNNTKALISKARSTLDSISKSVLDTMDGLGTVEERTLHPGFLGFTRASLSQRFALVKEISVSILSTLKFIILGEESQKKETQLEKLDESLGERIAIVHRILTSISVEDLFRASVEDIAHRNEKSDKRSERSKHPNQYSRYRGHEPEKDSVQNASNENNGDVADGAVNDSNGDDDDDVDVILYNYDDDENDDNDNKGRTKSKISFKGVQFPRTLNESLLKVELALSDIKRQSIYMNERDVDDNNNNNNNTKQ